MPVVMDSGAASGTALDPARPGARMQRVGVRTAPLASGIYPSGTARFGADEQPHADLRIGQPFPGQPGRMGLLAGQRLADRTGIS